VPVRDLSDEELDGLAAAVFDGAAGLASIGGVATAVPAAKDPFAAPRRRRVLVAGGDPSTLATLRRLDVDVIVARDGWEAVELLVEGDVDLALVPLLFSDTPALSGAKIHRLVRASRPEVAARIVFVADETTLADAPPSANGRVVARPIAADVVEALLSAKLGR
jgi:hypothetical protein